MDRATNWTMDMAIITADARFTGEEAMEEETEDMNEAT